MPSLFPGIDPFIEAEARWPDFHSSFITYWRNALLDALPDHYEASIDERITLASLDEEASSRLIEPDVAVMQSPFELATESSLAPGGPEPGSGVVAVRTLPEEAQVRERLIKIHHRPDHRLVAVLELLSPANKTNPGREAYLARRADILHQTVHLVELDLLLSGKRLPMRDGLPAGDAFAIVSRAERRPKCEVYAWSLADRLPLVAIPLLPEDDAVAIALQDVYDQTYDAGRYVRRIDYHQPPRLPIGQTDTRWIAATGLKIAKQRRQV